ncbi:MAG: cytochrome c3 family protein [Nitrospirota bacterium]
MSRRIPLLTLIMFCVLVLMAYGVQAETKKAVAGTLKGTVQDGSGQAIQKATVYLIPAADVKAMAKRVPEIRRDSPIDEPHEDLLARNRDDYRKATTDKKGNFTIAKIEDGKYFIYVEPSDDEHLPGGNISDKAMATSEFAGKPIKILLSGKIPENATYVGSTKCIGCHKEYAAIKKTLHKLGISVIGKPSKLQDYSRFPDFNAGLNKLTAGMKFYFYGFDKGRGFDKYQVSDKAPSDPTTVSFTATFFKDKDGTLKFKTENMKDPSDTPRTYPVVMTYGGGLYKQRYLFKVGNVHIPFLQFNPTGDWSYNDRTRKPWRDYHADWLFNEETKKLTDPPKKKSFEVECAACHYTGYSLTPSGEGGFITHAVNDPGGEADIDGDGIPNELNIGCEVCHGPGSQHVTAPKNKKAATIVSPGKLAAERSMVICNQCHSRPQGYLKSDPPLDEKYKMLLPGTSRNDYLTYHTTREDAAQKDYWPDGIHSKSHHQQGTDLVRSIKYLNGDQIMTCADCHDPHGMTEVKHQLRKPIRDEKNTLCTSCHKDHANIKAHTAKAVGVEHGMKIHCVDCHNPKTMQTGAGLGKGRGTSDGKNYWMNDITSHIFDVPRKNNVGVKGVEPGKAMPIPYTNACGTCHNVDQLPQKAEAAPQK